MSEISIRRYSDLAQVPELDGALNAIFFEASNTKSFESREAQAAFQERWLGRYLVHHAKTTFLALARDARVAGYIAGALDDPARDPLFADIPYFTAFKDLTARFPAHLHVNLAPEFRNRGVGSRLVQRFVEAVKEGHKSGVHVVTSRGARNVAFYERNGFCQAGSSGHGEREILFLARAV